MFLLLQDPSRSGVSLRHTLGCKVMCSRDTPESPNLADLGLESPHRNITRLCICAMRMGFSHFFGVDALFDDANSLWNFDVETRSSRSSMTE